MSFPLAAWRARCLRLCPPALAFFFVPPGHAIPGLESQGGLQARYYLTQDNRYSRSPWVPGYRLGFQYDTRLSVHPAIDLFFDVGSTTLISRPDTAAFLMDKVEYRVAPGVRISQWNHEASVLLSHECLHWLDRGRLGGSIYWTLAQLDVGSGGAYERNLLTRATGRSAPSMHSLDYRVGVGTFLTNDAVRYVSRNSDYRKHAHVLLRYNLAYRDRPLFFADLRQDFWTADEDPVIAQALRQYKGSARFNWVFPTRHGIGVLFTEYTYLDQTPYLNEHSLWSVGIRLRH